MLQAVSFFTETVPQEIVIHYNKCHKYNMPCDKLMVMETDLHGNLTSKKNPDRNSTLPKNTNHPCFNQTPFPGREATANDIADCGRRPKVN